VQIFLSAEDSGLDSDFREISVGDFQLGILLEGFLKELHEVSHDGVSKTETSLDKRRISPLTPSKIWQARVCPFLINRFNLL
jgi:hypothetical protein